MEASARYTALESGKTDMIYCNFKGDQEPDLLNFNDEKWVMTNPYNGYLGDYFLVKK